MSINPLGNTNGSFSTPPDNQYELLKGLKGLNSAAAVAANARGPVDHGILPEATELTKVLSDVTNKLNNAKSDNEKINLNGQMISIKELKKKMSKFSIELESADTNVSELKSLGGEIQNFLNYPK